MICNGDNSSNTFSKATPWKLFIAALETKDTKLEEIQGLTAEEDIKDLIRSVGITDILSVAKILTQFKNHQGNTKVRLRIVTCCFSSFIPVELSHFLFIASL